MDVGKCLVSCKSLIIVFKDSELVFILGFLGGLMIVGFVF